MLSVWSSLHWIKPECVCVCFSVSVMEIHIGSTTWMCSSTSCITLWPFTALSQSCWPTMPSGPQASSGSIPPRPGWISAPTQLERYVPFSFSFVPGTVLTKKWPVVNICFTKAQCFTHSLLSLARLCLGKCWITCRAPVRHRRQMCVGSLKAASSMSSLCLDQHPTTSSLSMPPSQVGRWITGHSLKH